MEDIFSQVREGKAFEVRMWLENTENDLNLGDDHRFSLLHWAAREGHGNIADMLIQRGARINATNMGDDTALHLAAAHEHRDIVHMLLSAKANVNAANEHGNTPLHYAAFWGCDAIAEDLVNSGSLVCLCNKYGETPLSKAKPYLRELLLKRATSLGQSTKPVEYKDSSWQGMKTRTRDATLSRQIGINLERLNLQGKLASTHSGDTYYGKLHETDIVAKVLRMREVTSRASRDFADEYPKLRIFNHPNVLPVMSASNQPNALAIVAQRMPYGSLYDVLHGDRANVVVDAQQALKFALDIACGMEFLHGMEPLLPGYRLSSKHVMVDEDLTARISMSDYKFSFHERAKMYDAAWISPEALQRRTNEINQRAADMWSFAILLWEMSTREVPFAELSPMEIGMKVALEGLRLTLPHGFSPHLGRLISIAMNEEPGKRPKFDMLIPILQKMKLSS